MPERQFKLDVGTIGSAPCEVALNRILIELNDAKVGRKILSRYNRLRVGLQSLKALRKTASNGFFKEIARMYYEVHKKSFEEQKDFIPLAAYTHAHSCFRALYRRAITEGNK